MRAGEDRRIDARRKKPNRRGKMGLILMA